MKEGLDINKLATTGAANIEFVPRNVEEVKEEEEQADNELNAYHQGIMDHLSPECADFDDRLEDEGADMTGMVKTLHHLIINHKMFPILYSRLHLLRWQWV